MSERTAAAGGQFRFEYSPPTIRFGEGSVAHLGDELERLGLTRALVVSGTTVGTAEDVIGPVTTGLGDHLGAVFAETTPKKRLSTAVAGAKRYQDVDADVIVGLGGGSSLDVAKQVAVAVASDLTPEELGAALAEDGLLPVPDEVPPIVAVPTTLAGADLSQGGGASANPKHDLVTEPTGGGVSAPQLMPVALVMDPELFATTPRSVLAASAMNGFDKGLESLYSPTGTPITDGTAMRGLSLLVDSLPALGEEPVTVDELNPIVRGILLVQYGISRPDASTMSLIHAFGHAISARGPHQGTAHATVAPHVLRYLFDHGEVRVDLLADALGVGDAEDHATAVVERVAHVRDGLGLPSELGSLEGIDRDDIPAMAEATIADRLSANVPPGVDLTQDDVEGILEAAW